MKPEKSNLLRRLAAYLLLASLSISTLSFHPGLVRVQMNIPAPQEQQPAVPAVWELDFELTPSSAQVQALGGPEQARAQVEDMLSSKRFDRYNATYAVEDGGDSSFHVILTGNGSVQDLRNLLYTEIAPELDLLDGVIELDVTAPVQAGQSIPVILQSRPSTGYGWELVQGDSALVQQLGEPRLQSFVEEPSAPAQTTLTLQSTADGEATIHLVYRRSWEGDSAPTRRIRLSLPEFPQQIDLSSPVQPQASAAPELPGPAVDEPVVGLPTHFDWRDQGKVPAVRDQGSCGSCWSFGTVAAMESAMMVQAGISADLSEQFLISCNKDGYSCNGGWWAHKYHQGTVANNQSVAGAVLESSMPYRATNASCTSNLNHPYKIGSWGYVTGSSNNIPTTTQIKNAIYEYGSVAVSVCSGSAWNSYRSGVFSTEESSQCGGSGQVNHAVHLVGWDDAGQYWILRNSWGPNWGENGYMRIKWGTSNVGYGASYVVYQGGSSPTQPAPTATKPAPTPTPAPTQIPVGPVPSNDSVNNPLVISYEGGKFSYSQSQDTSGATSEATDPTFPLSTRTKGYNTVWYQFTPAYKGKITAKTTGSNYDTILGVWMRTDSGGFKLVKQSDNYNSTKQSAISGLSVSTNVTYLIEVASRKSGGGNLVFNFSYSPSTPPANRISSAGKVTYAGNTKVTSYKSLLDVANATVTKDEPAVPDGRGQGYRTVWYKFKPTRAGTLEVQTTGSNYNTILTVYRTVSSKWTALGMNDDWQGLQSGFQMRLSPNVTYLIGVVSADPSGPSKLQFSLKFTPDP